MLKFSQRHPNVSLRKMEDLTSEVGGVKVSTATLSLIKNKKTEGEVSQAILASIIKVLAWYENQSEQPAKTSNLEKAMAICEGSYETGLLGMIIGESGFGKSVAFRTYLGEAAMQRGIIAVTAFKSMTKRPLLEALCDAVGMRYLSRWSPHRIMAELLDQSIKQIVIDEADRMSLDCFELLRYLHDRSGMSVVMFGLPCLMRKFEVASDKEDNLAQFLSRIDILKTLDPPTSGEIRDVIQRLGIQKEDLVSEIVKHAKVMGKINLHRVEKIVKALKETAVTEGVKPEDIPAGWVEEMIRTMAY
jgi:DNA transposition AAA+ family ATPase